MQYLEHRVAPDERWDTLSWRYYRDPHGYERIQRANPTQARTEVLPVGVVLKIPLIDPPTPIIRTGLPPWLSAR